MDGKVILSGLLAVIIAIAVFVIGWAAKLKLMTQVWSGAKTVVSIIARLFKKNSPPPGGIAAGDNASMRNIVVAGRDVKKKKVNKSRHRTNIFSLPQIIFNIFNTASTHDDVDEGSGAMSEENLHPGLPSEENKADNRLTADQSATESNNGVNATLPIVDVGRFDAREGVKSDRPVERSVVYEDDSDVSHAGDADERDLSLEAIEGLTPIASPSERTMEADWTPFTGVEAVDKVKTDEVKSFSENGAQLDQEAGVPDMEVSPAEIPRHDAVNESSAVGVSVLPPHSEVDGISTLPDSAIIQDFPLPKLDEAEGNGSLYSQNPGDPEPVPEDELAVILRSYPLVTIGEALRLRRIEVTISQPDINYDRGWVSQLEQGSFSPAPETLPKQKARLRRYLQVVGWTPEALLSRLAATE